MPRREAEAVLRRPLTAWSFARRLAADEEATAAVEFIILIPVYMLLIAGLFMTANLLLARQGLVQAARFQVWSYKDTNDATDPTLVNFRSGAAFFSVEGTFTPGLRTPVAVSQWSGRIKPSDIASGGGRHLDLAADVMNNWTGGAEERTLYRVTATPEFKYTGLVVFGLGAIPQTTQCGVLLPRRKLRVEYDSSRTPTAVVGRHPVLAWRANNTAGKNAYYNPDLERNMPLNPLFDGGANEFADRGDSANSGVWQKEARIGGDQGSEWSYYEGKPKRN